MSATETRLWRIYEDLCRRKLPSEADRAFLTAQAKRSLSDDEAIWLLRALGELRDPVAAPLIEPYLQRSDAPPLVHDALWALWRSGLQARYKDYILRAVNPGFDWDTGREVRTTALYGAGEYLRDHKDLDFARMIAELVDRNDDPLLRTGDEDEKVSTARTAAGLAMGGEAATLALHDNDDVLTSALVARFLAERRDG